jgi:hypothetical protein
MSFFTLSTGKAVEQNTSFEVSGGSLEPIPANSVLLAVIHEAKWDEHNGERNIKIRWDVIGEDYKGRVIFQKIRVGDPDPSKRDRALMMLAAIDANAGAHLSKLQGEPTDADLSKITMRKMGIMVDLWKITDPITGEEKAGNWVKMVASVKEAKAKLDQIGGNPKPLVNSLDSALPAKKQSTVVTVEEDDDFF